MLSVMALDMFSVLFGGAVAMLPAYADQILHVGSAGLGLLRASPAIGSIAATLFLALNPMKQVSGRRLLFVIAGFGFCIIGFGLSTVFWLSMLLLILSGLFDGINVVTRSTMLQLLIPEDMRGRVSSVNAMFVISSNEIGAFESGAAATLFGLVPSVVIGGLACLGVVAATALFFPPMRRLVVNADTPPAK
jgi:MFS family permease